MVAEARLYRFALFGRSNSGKTCILTALSLSHQRNPAGYTVTWLPDPPEATPNDKEVARQYQEGKQMLQRARQRMEAGESPLATALTILRYRFDFTASKPYPRVYHTELIDYSGELIHENVTAEAMARKLRNLLMTMDGLFVLAEVARPNERERVIKELELLRQAFALLSNERKQQAGPVLPRVPIALILNKWDRLHPHSYLYEQRDQQINQYLSQVPEPPHKQLAEYLQVVAGDSNCFGIFAASAFGEARQVEKQDLNKGTLITVECPPMRRPLPSFGLEDPFIWAAAKRDELDVDEFTEKVRNTRIGNWAPFFGLNALNPYPVIELRTEGRRLRSRFPSSAPFIDRINAAIRRATYLAMARSFLLLLALMTLMVSMETTYATWRIQKIKGDMTRSDNPSIQVLRSHQDFLESYYRAPWFRYMVSRLFIADRQYALNLRDVILEREEEIMWGLVQAVSPEQSEEIAIRAREYLERFPNGKYIQDAQRIYTENCIRAIDCHLNKIESSIVEMEQSKPDDDKLVNLQELLATIPFPEQVTPNQQNKIGDYKTRYSKLVHIRYIEKRKEEIRKYIRANDYRQASRIAWELMNKSTNIDDVIEDLKSQIRQSMNRWIQESKWDVLHQNISEIRHSWIAVGLLTNSRDLIVEIDKFEQTAWQLEDQQLYEYFRDPPPNKLKGQRYLNSRIPSEYKSMYRYVEQYMNYLYKIEQPLDLTIEIDSFHMGNRKAFVFCNLEMEIRLGNKTSLILKDQEWVPNTTYRLNKELKYTARLDDEVIITGYIRNRGLNIDDLGQLSYNITISKLNNTARLEFTTTNFYKTNHPSWVSFVVKGIPSPPQLPPYTKPAVTGR